MSRQQLAGLARQGAGVTADMSEPEVAAVLGVSVGTVKSTVARAVAKLREEAELGADGSW